MKFFFAFTCLLLSCGLTAQPNWKDSVKVKKVLDAYEYEGSVYFKVKKGWGVWDPQQKRVVVEPQFQFILRRGGANDGFLFVKGNKIGELDSKGAIRVQPKWYRRGSFQYSYSANNYQIYNDEVYSLTDSSTMLEGEYRQLAKTNEFSLTVTGNLILLNNCNGYSDYVPLVTMDGVDSVDVNGNIVYVQPDIFSNTQMFDLNKGAWLSLWGHKIEKFGYCGKNLIATILDNPAYPFLVYEQEPQRSTFLQLDSITQEELAKKILSSYQPVNLSLIKDVYSGSFPENYVTFYSNGKAGLFSLSGYTVKVEPIEYDFIYYSKAFHGYWFAAGANKLGLLNGVFQKPLYNADYDQISIKSVLANNEVYQKHITCNGFDPDLYNHNERVGIDSLPHRKWDFTQPLSSGQVIDNHVIINDFYPMGPESTNAIMIFDQYGEPRDSILRYDSEGYPVFAFAERDKGFSLGGVFNKSTKKWIVPQRYSNVVAQPDGYACMRFYADSLTFSFYSKNGDVVFKNKTIEELKKNSTWISKLVGDNTGGSPKLMWLDKRTEYGLFMGWPIVYSNNGRTGLFDLVHFQWIYPMEYDYIEYSNVNDVFLVFANGKHGIGNPYGKILIPPVFTRIQYCSSSDGYVCNDSVFYSISQDVRVMMLDTFKLDCRERMEGQEYDVVRFKTVQEKNMVSISEYKKWALYDYNLETYDLGDNVKIMDTAFSRVVDIKAFSPPKIANASEIKPWKGGWIVQKHDKDWYYTTDGKQWIDLGTSIEIEEDYIVVIEGFESFRLDNNGTLAQVVLTDDLFEVEGVRSIQKRKWFDGSTFYIPDKGFFPYALNKNKIAFGCKIETDKNFQVKKTYLYYNFSTKVYSECLLPLDPLKFLEVYHLEGYFLLVESDHIYDKEKVWFLENDLQNTKSEFLKLSDVRFEYGYTGDYYKPIVFSLVESDGQVMIFDKNFQFLAQSLTPDVEYTSPRWNRLKIKTRAKTIYLDSNGKLVK